MDTTVIDITNIIDTSSTRTKNGKYTKSLADTSNQDRNVLDNKAVTHIRNLVDTTFIATKSFDTTINDTAIAKDELETTDTKTTDLGTKDLLQVRDLDPSDISANIETINIIEIKDGTRDTKSLFDTEVKKILCRSASSDYSESNEIAKEIINEYINTIVFTQHLIYSITNNIDTDLSDDTLINTVVFNFDTVERNNVNTNSEPLKYDDNNKVDIAVAANAFKEIEENGSERNEPGYCLVDIANLNEFDTDGDVGKKIKSIQEPPNTKMDGTYDVNLDTILKDSLDAENDLKNDMMTKDAQDEQPKSIVLGIQRSPIHIIPNIPEIPKVDSKIVGTEIPTNTIDTEISMVIPKSLNTHVLNNTVDKIIGTSKVVPDASGESNSLEWKNEKIALERKINEMEQQVLMQLSRIIRILEKKDQT